MDHTAVGDANDRSSRVDVQLIFTGSESSFKIWPHFVSRASGTKCSGARIAKGKQRLRSGTIGLTTK